MESACFEFPSFEAFDMEDRPPPPSISDYPIGCEVELVDHGPAKIAQTEELWEPFMDDLFKNGHRLVRVVRHSGDYTFVMCENDPDMRIGCTLYRACLSEPKVRFKKYIPTKNSVVSSMARAVPSLPQSQTEQPPLAGNEFDALSFPPPNEEEGEEERENDPFMRAVAPDRLPEAVSASPTSPELAAFNCLSSPTRAVAAAIEMAGKVTQSVDQGRLVPVDSVTDKQKFNQAMSKGLQALEQGRYDESVMYYTEALAHQPDQTARILANRSVAYLGGHNAEAALNDACNVIRIAPQNFVGYVRVGNVLRHLKRYEEAKEYYDRALELEPANADVHYISLSNTVSMVYRAKMENCNSARVSLGKKAMKLKATARLPMRPNELAWSETPAVIIPLTTRKAKEVGGVAESRSCGMCGRSLIRESAICEAFPGLGPRLLRTLFTESNVVPCNSWCGVRYCSEACRAKGWADHHWVECPQQGKWGSAVLRAHKIFDDFATDPQRLRMASCGRMAVRMMARMPSTGRSLRDSVNMFMWLREAPASTLDGEIATRCLEPAHAELYSAFSAEERAVLTYPLFLKCYMQAQFNAIRVNASPWQTILTRAESHMALVKLRSESNEVLEKITASSLKNLPALSREYLALMEIYSVALEKGTYETEKMAAALDDHDHDHDAPGSASRQPPPHHSRSRTNLKVRRELESLANIPVLATAPIQRGEELRGA